MGDLEGCACETFRVLAYYPVIAPYEDVEYAALAKRTRDTKYAVLLALTKI